MIAFSGVRSSWDMLAKNSDLCWLAPSSCLNSRAFWMAKAHCVAKVRSSSTVSGEKSPGVCRLTTMLPIRWPSRSIGTASSARTPETTRVSRSRLSYAPSRVMSWTCTGDSVIAVPPTTPSPLRIRAKRPAWASAPSSPVAARCSNSSAASSYSKTTPPSRPESYTARETMVVSPVRGEPTCDPCISTSETRWSGASWHPWSCVRHFRREGQGRSSRRRWGKPERR